MGVSNAQAVALGNRTEYLKQGDAMVVQAILAAGLTLDRTVVGQLASAINALADARVAASAIVATLVSQMAAVNALPRLGFLVSFDQTVAANATAAYTQSGTTVTVNLTAHGYTVGHMINASATTGGTTANGMYAITSVSTNSFTYTSATSGTTSGNLTLTRRALRAGTQFNIHSVTHVPSGTAFVNFAAPHANANYRVRTSNRTTDAQAFQSQGVHYDRTSAGAPFARTVNYLPMAFTDAGITGFGDFHAVVTVWGWI